MATFIINNKNRFESLYVDLTIIWYKYYKYSFKIKISLIFFNYIQKKKKLNAKVLF